MGSKYTTLATSGYNSSAPSDGGAQAAENLISWSGIKTKLGDPVKTLADAINTSLVSAFDYSVRQVTVSDNTVASDHMRTVEIAPTVTTAVTISLGDAATMTTTYKVFVKNSSAVNQTIGRVTSGDTVDGIARNITIPAGACWLFQVISGATGYILTGAYNESEPELCDGRLTLTSGTAVTTADVVSATTVYFTPFRGNRMSLYDGTRWRRYILSEVSVACPSVSSTVHDIFIYDNAGTITLDATAWTNDTTRATALTTQDGVLVKTGATGRRYVGTIRTTGILGQTEDSVTKRYLWNYYNRVSRSMSVFETTSSWGYTIATWRQARATATNQLDYVCGVSEDMVEAVVTVHTDNTNTSITRSAGVGVDSTSANSAQLIGAGRGTTSIVGSHSSFYKGYPGVGRHTLVWLEISDAVGTTTWYSSGFSALIQSGIQGILFG